MRALLVLAVLLVGVPASASEAESPLASIDRDVDRTPYEAEVVEVLEAGPYRYARVVAASERWVVSLRRTFEAGDRVRVAPVGVVEDFTSVRTGRTFERLWFAAVRPIVR